MKLYQISDELERLLESEELTEADAARLDELGMALEEKAENICRLHASYAAEAKAYGDEAVRLSGKALGATKKAEWLKKYLQSCLERIGQKKLKTPLFSLSVCNNSRPSIRVEGEIPAEFQRVKIEFDSQKAYETWKATGELPAAITVEQGRHLRIS